MLHLRSFASRVDAFQVGSTPLPSALLAVQRSLHFKQVKTPVILLTASQQRRGVVGGPASSSSSSSHPSVSFSELNTPVDMPAPPRPASYVPPAERDPADQSLSFLPKEDPLQRCHESVMAEMRGKGGGHLGEGQDFAPQLAERQKLGRVFEDADAERVQSSSVHAGKPLLPRDDETSVGAGVYYTDVSMRDASDGTRSRLHVLRDSPRVERGGGEREMLSAGRGTGRGDHTPRDTMFSAKHEFSRLEDVAEENAGLPGAPPKLFASPPTGSPDATTDEGKKIPQIPLVKQIERDIKKLEYYHGTPQYPEMLQQFREKYAKGNGEGNADEPQKEEQQRYTTHELCQGLESQPIDFHRSSTKLQAQLSSGPYGYSPVTIMQQHGVMRFQGYAFPPNTELGKLKGVEDIKAMQATHRKSGIAASVRRSFHALIDRKDRREDYLAAEDTVREDGHFLYKTLKLDAVQRRQMRFMLTDFDYKDRNTAFHVMMSYPYTDWLHVFFMVLVGWGLYQLQVRYGAYEFYDEYLGLDLRQVPSVKKPLLAGVTVIIMIFFLFQPLLVASIATNRVYRIAMRRPIGPP